MNIEEFSFYLAMAADGLTVIKELYKLIVIVILFGGFFIRSNTMAKKGIKNAVAVGAGRPSKLNAGLIDQAWDYVNGAWQSVNRVPSVAGLSRYLKVSRSIIYEWASKNNEFSDILETIMSEQEMQLIDGTLGGSFNAPFAKLMMTKHGYSDKIETDVRSSDGSMTPKPAVMTTEEAAEYYRKMMA